MFENRRLNRLLETGEYQLPESMCHWIADAAHWIAPLMTFFGSILVGVLCLWLMGNVLTRGNFLYAIATSVGITQFLVVGLGAFWMFTERSCGPECWYDLTESCAIFGLTLDKMARKPLAEQVFLCEARLKTLAQIVIRAERDHPGEEYHENRVKAKQNFEKAFRHFQRVGWIEHNETYGKFFRQ